METGRKTIGILGAQSGVGVTQLSVAMAGYCSHYLKSRTALVELSGNHEIEQIQINGGSSLFHPSEIHCYANAGREQMAEIMGEGYEYCIIDAGNDYYRIREEFLRCDRQLIVVSLCPWKRKELNFFMSSVYEQEKWVKGAVFLAQFGKKKDKKDFRKEYRIPIQTFSYIEDAFCLTEADLKFLRTLL